MKELDNDLIMAELGTQFRRVQEKEYLTLLTETPSHIIVKFKCTLRPFTIKMVIRHIEQKYGSHVWVFSTENDPFLFEIWDKRIAF